MRYASIDLLRTIAIILMVLVHFLENLSGVDWVPGGFGAPMFGFLVGVSYRLWVQAQVARERTDEQIGRSTYRRGALIFAAGFLFNVAVWLPADTFNWDVLTLIGTAIVVLGLIRDFPAVVPIILAAVVYLISPILRIHSGFDEYWTNGYYDPDWTVSQLGLGYLVNGYFPVFPWLVFPLAGYVAGARLQPAGPTWRQVRPLAWVGLGFIAVWCGLRFSPSNQLLRGWTMFPASVEYVTGMLGGSLLAFAACAWWVDGRRGLERFVALTSFTRTMSQHSLSIYVFHHVIHLWPLWVYGLIAGPEATHYWRTATAWPIALALGLGCLALSYLLFRWVERGKWPSLESLIRRLSDGTTPPLNPPRDTLSERTATPPAPAAPPPPTAAPAPPSAATGIATACPTPRRPPVAPATSRIWRSS